MLLLCAPFAVCKKIAASCQSSFSASRLFCRIRTDVILSLPLRSLNVMSGNLFKCGFHRFFKYACTFYTQVMRLSAGALSVYIIFLYNNFSVSIY